MKKNTPETCGKENFIIYFDILNIIACLAVQQKLVMANEFIGGMCFLLGCTNIFDVIGCDIDELQRKVLNTDVFQKTLYSYRATVVLLEYYHFNMESFNRTNYFGII